MSESLSRIIPTQASAERLRDFRQAHEWPMLGQVFLRFAELMRDRVRLPLDDNAEGSLREVGDRLFGCG